MMRLLLDNFRYDDVVKGLVQLFVPIGNLSTHAVGSIVEDATGAE